MKRLLSFVLMLTLILTMIPVNVSAAQGDKLIALTFDDGPSKNSEEILDILAEYDAKVTFFLIGSEIREENR